MTEPRQRWNERYRESDPPTEPNAIVEQYAEKLSGERALDVATGGGRNAIALAERGFTVEAIDIADEAIEIAQERATERGLDIQFVREDVETYSYPVGRYDLINVSQYYSLDTLAELTRALAPGGVLLYEQNIQAPGDEHRFRFYPNDLLRACLDLRIVHYEEPLALSEDETTVSLVARRPPADGRIR